MDIDFVSREELIKFHDFYYWTSGGEGNIYKVPENNNNTIWKLFYSPYRNEFHLPEKTISNKQQKVHILKSMVLPNQIQIIGKVFFKGEFIGYVLTEAKNYQDLAFNTFNKFQKVEFLRRLRNQLQRFHELKIIYGDLKSDNVLSHITNYRLGCLCDLDNVQIGEHPIDITSEYVDEFLFQYGDVDENLDWYVLNLLTLEIIFGLDQTSYTAFYETRSFMDRYHGKSEALREMQHITSQYNGSLLIDDPTFYEEIGIPYYKKN